MSDERLALLREFGPKSFDDAKEIHRLATESLQRAIISDNPHESAHWLNELFAWAKLLPACTEVVHAEVLRRMDEAPTWAFVTGNTSELHLEMTRERSER